ncbi:galactokinase [Nocardioides piscis]|uniref:Galactokinase n=1 Tax=Nocardioides piscis TaxID=2714938 RepID=A0A6G7YBM2_9ACTN|nr:galactokinase [Nocardioides piscis]QIK74193.1 galactokinase [Nocardioides piscis]
MAARAFAPGRVNLIGEHTDYNDGFVLPMALEMGCTASVRLGGNAWVAHSRQQAAEVSVQPTATPDEAPVWARYVLGPLWLLQRAGVEVPPLRVEVDSDVPLGAGLSSSAALVCSVATALVAALELDPDGAPDLLALTRAVENDVVGVPTGGMDQLVSLRARQGHALWCDMRSLVTRPVPFDLAADGLALLVVDTRVSHRNADGAYADRCAGCQEAARRLGVRALRDVAGEELEPALSRLDDEVLRRLVRHVVTENERVLRTVELLEAGRTRDVGRLLSDSHSSMRDDFRITVSEVDLAVRALVGAGAHGARMTGGGFGGCVLGLVESQAVQEAEAAVLHAFAHAGLTTPATFTASAGGGARVVDG